MNADGASIRSGSGERAPGVRAATEDDGLSERLDRFLALSTAEAIEQARRACAEDPRAIRRDEVHLFAPLYLASPCANDCTYCGFRRSARVQRMILGPAELLAEARVLADAGHRSIDLVTGEIPRDVFVDSVCRAVELVRARTPIERVHLNLGALSEAQYRRLRNAGAVGYHLYQETYDPTTYTRVHPAGPKRVMAWRLEAPARALSAGFEHIGLGVLLGLAGMRAELVALVRHARGLRRAHPNARLGFSLPRLKAHGADRTGAAPFAVDDRDFLKAFLFLAGELPDAHLTITTREPAAIRDLLIATCATKASAGAHGGASVRPGGYSGLAATEPQFAIHDGRSLAEVAAVVERAGKRPVGVDLDLASRATV